jgi:hypothetical protein
LLSFHFFFWTVYPNLPPENKFQSRSMVVKSVAGMFLTSVLWGVRGLTRDYTKRTR